MRERFGDWGTELSDAEFACALAAAGLLRRWAKPSWTAERLASELLDKLQGRAPVWLFSKLMLQFDARALAQAWRLLRKSLDDAIVPVVVDVSSLHRQGIDPTWLANQLTREEVGAASVNIDLTFRPTTDPTFRPPTGRYNLYQEEYYSAKNAVQEAPLRFLQAQLERSRRANSLWGSYRVNVRIGLSDREWMAVEKPFPVPLEPPRPEGHRLMVIFWEPRVSPKPQVQPLLLPPEGSTQEISFPFEIPAGLDRIEARVTVLHANRVLQTGLLRASFAGRRLWTFTLDATPRTRLEGLSARSQFDVALVLNHDDEGTARVTATTGENAVVLAIDDGPLRKLTGFLNTQISAIADDPDRFEGLESLGSIELLRSLARMGATVYDQLCEHTELVHLREACRIHITSAKVESFLPAELLYCFPKPSKTAQVCPHALAALESGDCTAKCATEKGESICPLGFWGLSRVIERHAHRREDQKRVSRDFELRAEPVHPRSPLFLNGSALLAASGKVASVKKDAVTELLKKLQERGPATLASSWTEWEARIQSDQPRLLVILPHHERGDDGFEVLEIGDGQRLDTVDIEEDLVRRTDGPSPVVLLMGCETNLTQISFDNPASLFRDCGAAVVVSTIATILGRHASPATAVLVELLDQMADGTSTFGDVMLRLRQKMVARATPMALGLTSYGDADWILTKEG